MNLSNAARATLLLTAVSSVVSNELYHLSIPMGESDGNRNLASRCSFQYPRFSCAFETGIAGKNGTAVPIGLEFDCVWNYNIDLDIRNSDCHCLAYINPGDVLKERTCSCTGCPRGIASLAKGGRRYLAEEHRAPGEEEEEDSDTWGVAIDCGPQGFTQKSDFATIELADGAVIDNCTSVDCLGQCNGDVGLENIKFPTLPPAVKDANSTNATDATDATDANETASIKLRAAGL